MDLAEAPPSKFVAHERKKQQFSVVSLFSGCGGLDLGFRGGFEFLNREYARLPFQIEWANEINPRACATYRANLGEHIREGDIWHMMDQLPPRADVVIGGFPCQDVSVNGKGAGIEGRRSGLYRAMVEVVRRLSPHAFVAENVKGLFTKRHQKDLDQILSDFGDLGYQIHCGLYRAHEYGVPQTRERVFIVGVKPPLPCFSPPPIQLFNGEYISASQALGDLEGLAESEEFSHIWSKAQKSPDQGCRRLIADRPGYTVRAECHGNIQFHYALDRRISMREAARVQSFPDTFLFQSRLRETERQIGNAVPPVLAWHVARQLSRLLLGSLHEE